MIQLPLPVCTAFLVWDVLGMCLGYLATIRENWPQEHGRHRAR